LIVKRDAARQSRENVQPGTIIEIALEQAIGHERRSLASDGVYGVANWSSPHHPHHRLRTTGEIDEEDAGLIPMNHSIVQ
jgi:hypothetical protein